jgi:hypothetical protein
MKRYTAIAIVAITLVFASVSAPAHQNSEPVIQMAILLDTSNSMDGLINQARTQLWKIVNEFIEAQKKGRKPDLQVALYEYGNSRLSRESGFIRQVLPLTTDLDKVSQELFALTTNGGDEYCGHVIAKASRDLRWSSSDDDLKVIFIAGNEPFTQGSVDYTKSVKAAITRGIVVNTIHCGTEQGGIRGKWKDGALLADGSYMFIDQNKPEVYIEAPQDKRLAELGEKLNETYIGYGAKGRAGKSNQAAQDTNARESSVSSSVNRAVFKSASQYNNAAWDLVDALDQDSIKLSGIDLNDLPENMQKMTPAEQQAYVDGKRAERQQIQNEINDLNNARKAHLAKRMKDQAGNDADTLDSAMTKTIQSMMAKKDFQSE